jgi:hypothetical protein
MELHLGGQGEGNIQEQVADANFLTIRLRQVTHAVQEALRTKRGRATVIGLASTGKSSAWRPEMNNGQDTRADPVVELLAKNWIQYIGRMLNFPFRNNLDWRQDSAASASPRSSKVSLASKDF